ncbi:autoinducer 1 sensor kinase/phosphatase LuxN [Striga asiatica]|uniref:Autoinducer 1 sensor kinase/phosphatase LuxN n=1 Tax=Striga asiatica TaxID=4170 RepID=A0A5A7NZZ4_STRAF|nr:autoinducer 1 sensor kinase/phosphatase LuxN [Striga asiatica]
MAEDCKFMSMDAEEKETVKQKQKDEIVHRRVPAKPQWQGSDEHRPSPADAIKTLAKPAVACDLELAPCVVENYLVGYGVHELAAPDGSLEVSLAFVNHILEVGDGFRAAVSPIDFDQLNLIFVPL